MFELYSKFMRVFPLLLMFLAICGCRRAPTQGQAEKQKPGGKDGLPDLIKVSEFVFARYGKLGYDKLARPEKVFVCVSELDGEVNNGGFSQYYFNSSGDHALDAEDSLTAIGAKETSRLLKQANALFGPAGPSPNRSQRQKQLEALDEAKAKKMEEFEKKFYKFPEKLADLLGVYVSKNGEVFQSK